jgi:hypothetical protein
LGGHVHGGRPPHVRWNGNNNCLGVTLPHSESKVIRSVPLVEWIALDW